MRDPYYPAPGSKSVAGFPNPGSSPGQATGPTLSPAHFVDTSGFGVVPFRVTNPGAPAPILRQAQDEAGGSGPTTPTPHGELKAAPVEAGEPRGPAGEPRPTLDALRLTIDAIAHEARWRGPPRDLPLSERMAGRRTVARLNEAIAGIAALLAQDPPSESRAIQLTPVPTQVLVTLADLKPALAMAARALRWLEERRHWRELRAGWGER